jgi:hypothetical protein
MSDIEGNTDLEKLARVSAQRALKAMEEGGRLRASSTEPDKHTQHLIEEAKRAAVQNDLIMNEVLNELDKENKPKDQ